MARASVTMANEIPSLGRRVLCVVREHVNTGNFNDRTDSEIPYPDRLLFSRGGQDLGDAERCFSKPTTDAGTPHVYKKRCSPDFQESGNSLENEFHGTEADSWVGDDPVQSINTELSQRNLRQPPYGSSILDSDCHSCQQVALVLPFATTLHDKTDIVDHWLSEISKGSMLDLPELEAQQQHLSPREEDVFRTPPMQTLTFPYGNPKPVLIPSPPRVRSPSNKENATLVYPILSSTAGYYLPSPATLSPPISSHARLSKHLSTHFFSGTQQPKRKKPHAAPISAAETIPEAPFMIYDDEQVAQLKVLSPNVEQHRKGRGPKRKRSSRHWETDILPNESSGLGENREKREEGEGEGTVDARGDRNGSLDFFNSDVRKILGESDLSAELTRPKFFLNGVEEAEFEFRVDR